MVQSHSLDLHIPQAYVKMILVITYTACFISCLTDGRLRFPVGIVGDTNFKDLPSQLSIQDAGFTGSCASPWLFRAVEVWFGVAWELRVEAWDPFQIIPQKSWAPVLIATCN